MSPLNTAPKSGAYQQTDPGECPGVCRACISSAGDAERLVVGYRAKVSCPGASSATACRRPGAAAPARRVSRRVRVPTVTWSLWPWVQTTATTLRPRDGVDDRRRGVRGVEHHDVGVVADQPDVVVDFPTAAVEFEGAVGDDAVDVGHQSITTERSTLPSCILWKASSTSSRPMRSETNFSSGSRPCR